MIGRLSEVSVLGPGMCFNLRPQLVSSTIPLSSSIHIVGSPDVLMRLKTDLGARKSSNFLTYPHEGTSLIYTHLWIHVFFDRLKRQLFTKKGSPDLLQAPRREFPDSTSNRKKRVAGCFGRSRER